MPRKKINEQKTNESLKKAKILITIVDRNKVEFYLDVLSQFEINLQFVTYGRGTASNEALELLGLNNYKGIIFSVVREDMAKEVLKTLEEKFSNIKKGKGVCVKIPIASVMGVNLYQFMINNRERRRN